VFSKRPNTNEATKAVPSLTTIHGVRFSNSTQTRIPTLLYYDTPDTARLDAGTSAAGSDGALFLPWLLGSIAPSPNDDVRAAFTGLGLHHHRRHMVRAALEGVALNVAWLLPHVIGVVAR